MKPYQTERITEFHLNAPSWSFKGCFHFSCGQVPYLNKPIKASRSKQLAIITEGQTRNGILVTCKNTLNG